MPKRVTPAEIFNYMDGSGELYLGYRCRFLDVWEYSSPGEDIILVELYQMLSSDDAFGLLSGDWGGEPVGARATTGEPRALYGAGLLRIWAGDVYARVLAYRESESSRQAVRALGRAILSQGSGVAVPALVRSLPESVGAVFELRAERSAYLRSHLVLNAVYFLSSENLLDLGPNCELVASSYTRHGDSFSAEPVRLLVARYPNQNAAVAALRHFLRVYLPECKSDSTEGYASIEDGWAGFRLAGRSLMLVFESPNEPSAHLFIDSATQAVQRLEIMHE